MDSIQAVRHRLTGNPRDEGALRFLGEVLTQGSRHDALRYWSREFTRDEKSDGWLREIVAEGMRNGGLRRAGRAAELYALLRWGGSDCAEFRGASLEAPAEWPTPPSLTHAKLRHDIAQFEYLRTNGILDAAFLEDVQGRYEAADARLLQRGERQPLDDEDREQIGRYYNRILYLRPTPRMARTLSPLWDRAAVQRTYLERGSGVVVIDDFLTDDALTELRAFCLESTIWFANRYAHGRLGAFFYDGFTCPLLTQVAEELREELAAIFLPQYPLTQVWAFKNTQHLPDNSTTHADFAAVTANLWITPDAANTRPGQGGLTIHNIDAPLHWDFVTYNGRSDVIRRFLDSHGASTITIPYRQNRAVIFNADLFHGTREVTFKPEYEHHRINVSWLYGRREDDAHRPAVHAPVAASRVRPWRSTSLRRFRYGEPG
jgi:hypothetical protein